MLAIHFLLLSVVLNLRIYFQSALIYGQKKQICMIQKNSFLFATNKNMCKEFELSMKIELKPTAYFSFRSSWKK